MDRHEPNVSLTHSTHTQRLLAWILNNVPGLIGVTGQRCCDYHIACCSSTAIMLRISTKKDKRCVTCHPESAT